MRVLVSILALGVFACHGAAPPTTAEPVPSAGAPSSSAGSEAPGSTVATATSATVASTASSPASGRVALGVFENPPTWDIKGVIRDNLARFDACWAEVLKSQPNERGKLSVRFIVSSEGKVTKTEEVKSTFHDPGLSQCVQRTLSAISWPAPSGTATVVLPFVFRP